MKRPTSYFFTPSFEDEAALQGRGFDFAVGSGFDFVAGFETSSSDIEKFVTLEKWDKFKEFLRANVRRAYTFSKCEIFTQAKPTIELFKTAFCRLTAATYESEKMDDSLEKLLDKALPSYIKKELDFGDFTRKISCSLKPVEGMKSTNNMLERAKTDGTRLIKMSRLVIRAEDELLQRARELSEKGIKVQVFSADLDQLRFWTQYELRWMVHEPSYKNLAKKEFIQSVGVVGDPIYVLRMDGETRPHLLGNLLTMFRNLLEIYVKANEDPPKIDLQTENLQFYLFRGNAEFRGTLKYDNLRNIKEGIGLIFEQWKPGRLGNLSRLKKKELKIYSDEFEKIIEKSSTRVQTIDQLEEELIRCKYEMLNIVNEDAVRGLSLGLSRLCRTIGNRLESFELEKHEKYTDLPKTIRDWRYTLWDEGYFGPK